MAFSVCFLPAFLLTFGACATLACDEPKPARGAAELSSLLSSELDPLVPARDWLSLRGSLRAVDELVSLIDESLAALDAFDVELRLLESEALESLELDEEDASELDDEDSSELDDDLDDFGLAALPFSFSEPALPDLVIASRTPLIMASNRSGEISLSESVAPESTLRMRLASRFVPCFASNEHKSCARSASAAPAELLPPTWATIVPK